jgi:LysM repeat protein
VPARRGSDGGEVYDPAVRRVWLIGAVLVAVPLTAAACGSDTGGTGTLPPIATTTSTSTTLATTTTRPTVYVVEAGDNLSKIATKLGVTKDDLMALNGITNPDHIEVGQKLKIPQPGEVIPTTVPPTEAPTTAGG